MGGDVSWQRRVGGQASLGQDPQGIEVATGGVDGGSPRCGALQGDVPGGAVCPPQGSAWFEESGGGSRTLHPRDLLSHTEAEPTLPRAWRRLSPPAAFGGSVHKAASSSVGEARAQGPARGGTPTRIGGLYSSVFSHQPSLPLCKSSRHISWMTPKGVEDGLRRPRHSMALEE